ncbi:hypothetical protein QNH10_01620 [Sporosarcina thermotolerans]|uniref:hypothetical protein n=1 Tax=Sporosarcina thermotolerans TaxID=633404 RepID=UPI0024BBF56E|nr:hypothetical protein [Sporosarcina thermotolerans]WHT48562.1 hypothetical protein QNH10_01620 [Sporosarcina thermotolerans]
MKKLLPFVLLILLLSACNESVSITNEEIPDSSSLTETNFEPMPNSIPDDFGFSLQFGITKKNEINTFNGTFTKDLITAGTVTTDLTLTEEEMVSIYEMMKDVKFAGPSISYQQLSIVQSNHMAKTSGKFLSMGKSSGILFQKPIASLLTTQNS